MLKITRLAATAALAVALPAGAGAASLDFTSLPDATTASLAIGGVTVTGSGDVSVRELNGLGIVGGIDSNLDGTETILFSFDTGAATGVIYSVGGAGNSDGDVLLGERSLKVFDPTGGLLGTFAQAGSGFFSVSDLVAGVQIGSFSLTAVDGDNIIIDRLEFTPEAPAVTPIPLPATAALLAGGLGLMALRRRRG